MPKNEPSKKPIIDMPSKEQLETATRPYSDEELKLTPEMEEKMKKLMEFFDNHGMDYSKFVPKFYSYVTDKKAYPNYDQYQHISNQHDMRRWMYALKDIHYKQKAGFLYRDAIKQATQGWQKMEIYDFLNWLKFHEEGAHMKYKFAQVWYENGQPGYFLHIKPDAQKETEPKADGDSVEKASQDAERSEEKRQTIEKQRSKIIGRLDSAEKLLRSQEGQEFAGGELENLMEAIYTLKKKVQLVNKLSVSTRLYEDMIVREGNVLKRNGFVKAAEMLYSLAQTPGQAGEGTKDDGKQQGGAVPPATPPADPSGAGNPGAPGGLPAQPPGVPSVQTPVGGDQNDPPQPKGIKDFIDNMNDGNKTDASESEDNELEVHDTEDELMVTEAQVAPVAPGPPPAALEDVPTTDTPKPERNPPAFVPDAAEKEPGTPGDPGSPATEEPLEVTEDDIKPGGDKPEPAASNFDSKVDEVFKSLTIGDVVAKLEDISKSYKTREMPRQLGIVDMMLDSLGLASLFPSLSEAQNKALEANNYISTRVDDILAKLRGAMASAEKAPAVTAPEREDMAGIRGKLQGDQDKEKQRKQMRKEQEAAEMEGAGKEEGKETPAVEMGELAAPVPAPVPPPPAAPAAPRPPAV